MITISNNGASIQLNGDINVTIIKKDVTKVTAIGINVLVVQTGKPNKVSIPYTNVSPSYSSAQALANYISSILGGFNANFVIENSNQSYIAEVNYAPFPIPDTGITNSDNSYNASIPSADPTTFPIPDTTIEVKDSAGTVIQSVNIPSATTDEVTVGDATVQIFNSVPTLIETVTVPAEGTGTATIRDSTVNLNDTLGNSISVSSVPADTVRSITAPNANVQLKDSAGNNIGSVNSYRSNTSNNLPAPDGSITNSNSDDSYVNTVTVRSGQLLKANELPDIALVVNDQNGNNLLNVTRPSVKNLTEVVTVPTALNLTISASTITPVTNQTVNFTGGCTNGTPTQWLWSFGDGGASTLQNPTYSYRYAGTYTVILTATDGTNDGYVVFSSTITVTLQTLFSTNLQQYLACGIGASPSNMTLVSGAISQWNDESGNNYHVTQGTITSRPAYGSNLLITSVGTFGGGAFDGANDFLQNTSAGFTRTTGSFEMLLIRKKRFTVLEVYSEATSGNFYEIFSLTNNATIGLFNGSLANNGLGYTINDFFILQIHWNGASSYMQINELSRYTIPNNIGTNSSVGTTIGATFAGASPAQMDMLEKLVYSSKPSDANITTIINRWKSKFGLW